MRSDAEIVSSLVIIQPVRGSLHDCEREGAERSRMGRVIFLLAAGENQVGPCCDSQGGKGYRYTASTTSRGYVGRHQGGRGSLYMNIRNSVRLSEWCGWCVMGSEVK